LDSIDCDPAFEVPEGPVSLFLVLEQSGGAPEAQSVFLPGLMGMDRQTDRAAAGSSRTRADGVELCLIGQHMIKKNDNLVLRMWKILSNMPVEVWIFL